MLTALDEERLREGGGSVHHDHAVEALWSGEPFLQEGVLGYFDGAVVRFYALPMAGAGSVCAEAARGLALSWAGRQDVLEVSWTGTAAFSLKELRAYGYRCVENKIGDQVSAELWISCLPGRGPSRRLLQRAQGHGLVGRRLCGGMPRAEHLRLIERFQRARSIHKRDPDASLVIPSLLVWPDVQLLEARHDGGLSGVLALHKPFRQTAVALFIAHDDVTAGVCDFLYSQMLECSRDLGATAVNVGPSPTEGVLAFKSKWGGVPAVPPYRRSRWVRGRLLRRRHTSWAARLLSVR